MTKAEKAERQQAIADLRELLKPGDTVYTILDHVSRSGMARAIRVLVPAKNPDGSIAMYGSEIAFLHPNYKVGLALGLKHWRRNGREQDALLVHGCGMDMGFHLVYSLGRALYPSGFGCVGAACPSNDHTNGDRHYDVHTCTADQVTSGNAYATHHQHSGVARGKYGCCHWHQDGGYALRHRWL